MGSTCSCSDSEDSGRTSLLMQRGGPPEQRTETIVSPRKVKAKAEEESATTPVAIPSKKANRQVRISDSDEWLPMDEMRESITAEKEKERLALMRVYSKEAVASIRRIREEDSKKESDTELSDSELPIAERVTDAHAATHETVDSLFSEATVVHKMSDSEADALSKQHSETVIVVVSEDTGTVKPEEEEEEYDEKIQVVVSEKYTSVTATSSEPTEAIVSKTTSLLSSPGMDSTERQKSLDEQKCETTPLKHTFSVGLRTAVALSHSVYVFWQSQAQTKAGMADGVSKQNQDAIIQLDSFGPNGCLQLYGVADGHGPVGHLVSEYAARRLPQLLLANSELLIDNTELALRIATDTLGAELLPLESEQEQEQTQEDVCGAKVAVGPLPIAASSTPTSMCESPPQSTMISPPLELDSSGTTTVGTTPSPATVRASDGGITVDDDSGAVEAGGELVMDSVMEEEETGSKVKRTESGIDTKFSGTTLSCVLRVADVIFTLNVGDSRCVLAQMPKGVRYGEAFASMGSPRTRLKTVQLTRDHCPQSVDEKKRLEEGGAKVVYDMDNNVYRVQMFHALGQSSEEAAASGGVSKKKAATTKMVSSSVSRSLGDWFAKEFGVIGTADITRRNIEDDDLFVICASDGVWHLLESEMAVKTMAAKLVRSANIREMEDLESSVRKLVNEASAMWNEEYYGYLDDISVVVARMGKRLGGKSLLA